MRTAQKPPENPIQSAPVASPEGPSTGASILELVTTDRLEILGGLEMSKRRSGASDRERLRWIAASVRGELWRFDGARNVSEWLSAHLDISNWKARRWAEASLRIETLPYISAALTGGVMSLDKVIELTRFATPDTEEQLIKWALKVNTSRVRERADEYLRTTASELDKSQASVAIEWYPLMDDLLSEMKCTLPTDQMLAMRREVEHLARELPKAPDLDGSDRAAVAADLARRWAEALFIIVTTGGSEELRAPEMVLHIPLEAISTGVGTGLLEGAVLGPEILRRIGCDCRLSVVIHGKDGNALGIGDTSRTPPRWLRRQVMNRDGHQCRFPGCEMKRYLITHHIQHWGCKGPTDYDNLLCVCFFHHELIHVSGWSVMMNKNYETTWFRPSGRVYDPNGSVPEEISAQVPDKIRCLDVSAAVPYSHLFSMPLLN